MGKAVDARLKRRPITTKAAREKDVLPFHFGPWASTALALVSRFRLSVGRTPAVVERPYGSHFSRLRPLLIAALAVVSLTAATNAFAMALTSPAVFASNHERVRRRWR
jgi:hypothetical protein